MTSIITQIVIVALMIGMPIAWDIVVAIRDEETISQVLRDWGHAQPVLIYAASVMPGHWWVNFDRSLVQMVGGNATTELAVVVWIAWTIHWSAEALGWQLTPWRALALIIASVLIGAALWTQDPVSAV